MEMKDLILKILFLIVGKQILLQSFLKTGKIVWKIGPNWNDEDIKHIDFIIGPHHAHLIPQGLPGAGNILVFDNGGWGGYGLANPSSKDGLKML